MQKSNTNKKSQVSNEVPKEIAPKVSKERNVHKLTLKEYLNQEEKNEDEKTKTKTEKIEGYDNEKENKIIEREESVEKKDENIKTKTEKIEVYDNEKENKIVEREESEEKKDPEQKEEEVDEKEKRKDEDEIEIDKMKQDSINEDRKVMSSKNDEFADLVQSTLNLDIIKKAISSMNNGNKTLINSSKFEFIGDLHQQIITGVENGNSIFNRFEIDNDILNNYKQYYEQLINFINIFDSKTLSDIIIQDDYSSQIEQIEKIISAIYTTLYGRNGLKDIDEITEFFIDENIDSDENLKGNNILKILANLAIAILDCFRICQYGILQLYFGEKISIGGQFVINGEFFMEALNQCETINNVFGIKSQK